MPTSNAPSRRRKRCCYFIDGKRCTRDGNGNPPMCFGCRRMLINVAQQRRPVSILAEAMADFLSGKPINKEATIGAAEEAFAQWTQNLGAQYRPDIRAGESESSAHRRAQPGPSSFPWWEGAGIFGGQPGQPQQARRQAPRVDPEQQRIAAAELEARRVMGFAESERLDEDTIKRRHRELSKRYHPDRGGSTEKMAVVNNAADVLRQSLG